VVLSSRRGGGGREGDGLGASIIPQATHNHPLNAVAVAELCRGELSRFVTHQSHLLNTDTMLTCCARWLLVPFPTGM
jgi:hypothetical protein